MLRTTHLNDRWEFAEASWQGEGARLETSRLEWLPAQVPGHVHLDLVKNGLIEHPFKRMAELGCQWVDDRAWSYRTTFDWAPDKKLPYRILHFEGLDTICRIFLNGQPLAEHDNMFLPLEVDVSKRLKQGRNEVQIDFQPAARIGAERMAAYLEKHKLGDKVPWMFDRSFVRKMQCSFGWDWGPRLVGCGIWKPVSLLEFDARIGDVHVTTNLMRSGAAEVVASSDTLGLAYHIEGAGQPADKLPKSGKTKIDQPVLWRTQGAYTYSMVAALDTGYGDPEIRRIEFGIRTIELLEEPDRYGKSFKFLLNGEPLWARGANWIPNSPFPASTSLDQLTARLHDAGSMQMNMLRVWGGGLYESDEFYHRCNRLGILVWQDFPYACAYYPDDPEHVKAATQEAEYHIKRLRHHPSLALWCGNNENLQMHQDGWGGKEEHPSRCLGDKIYDKAIPDLLAKLDPDRPYIPTSPHGGKYCNSQEEGDNHNWDAWHGRGDWRYYAESKARFSSEYGFASSCSVETWKTCLDPEDWNPRSSAVRWHDKTGKGTETFIDLVKLHYPEPVTLEDWVYYSQLNQRDAMRCAVEHYRTSGFCDGSLIWQLNDCWPGQSWSLVDSEGRKKAAAFEVRRLYSSLLLTITRDEDLVRIHAVSNARACSDRELNLWAIDLATGEQTAAWSARLSLEADMPKVVLECSVKGLPVSTTLLFAECGYHSTWRLLGEPKNARFAPGGGSYSPEDFPFAPLEPQTPLLMAHGEDGLKIRTETPVVDLFLWDPKAETEFGDNFLTILPNRPKTIQVSGKPKRICARSLAGYHPVRLVRGPI